jgi:hypothetical protein
LVLTAADCRRLDDISMTGGANPLSFGAQPDAAGEGRSMAAIAVAIGEGRMQLGAARHVFAGRTVGEVTSKAIGFCGELALVGLAEGRELVACAAQILDREGQQLWEV